MITVYNKDSSIVSSVQPSRLRFNTVLDAWAKTKGNTSAENAHTIFNRMEELSQMHEDLYPDTISYSSVISSYARSGRDDAGDRAEELLQRSLKLYNEGQYRLKPDSITFISILDALSNQFLRIFRNDKKS